MHLPTIFSLAVAFASIVAAANSAAYEAMAKAAKKPLALGTQHGFKSGSSIGHQRLIVAKVTGKSGALDIDANVYELFKIPDPAKPKKMKVDLGHYKDYESDPWDCTRGKYTYKGEVLQSLSPSDIQTKGEDLMIGKDRYSKLTNNCQHYVKNLYKEIQARALLAKYDEMQLGIEQSEAAFEKRQESYGVRWTA